MNLIVTRMDNYFPVYIIVLKSEPLGKKGTFVGYYKSSKDDRIYIPRSRKIKVSRDVTFEEEMAIRKGRGSNMEIDDDEEMRLPPPPNIKRVYEEMNKLISPIDAVELDDAPTDMAVSRKRPTWAQQILQNAEEHEALHGADESIKKYKAKFVARGFSQKEGVDYDETFAPVARYTSIRSIIAITSAVGWKLYQMDVKIAFLNGIVDTLLLRIRSMIKAE